MSEDSLTTLLKQQEKERKLLEEEILRNIANIQGRIRELEQAIPTDQTLHAAELDLLIKELDFQKGRRETLEITHLSQRMSAEYSERRSELAGGITRERVRQILAKGASSHK